MKRVYFIKPVGMDGPIKIGSSQMTERRREQLATWSPFALEVVAEIEGDPVLERRFHARFVDLHERREWFTAAPDLLEVIAEIQSGTFDIETLPAPRLVNGQGPRSQSSETRLQTSYSMRVDYAERRTGLYCPVSPFGMVKAGDRKRIAAVEAFLADPEAHGVSHSHRGVWHSAEKQPWTPPNARKPDTPDTGKAAA